jgi:hypothetical protein
MSIGLGWGYGAAGAMDGLAQALAQQEMLAQRKRMMEQDAEAKVFRQAQMENMRADNTRQERALSLTEEDRRLTREDRRAREQGDSRQRQQIDEAWNDVMGALQQRVPADHPELSAAMAEARVARARGQAVPARLMDLVKPEKKEPTLEEKVREREALSAAGARGAMSVARPTRPTAPFKEDPRVPNEVRTWLGKAHRRHEKYEQAADALVTEAENNFSTKYEHFDLTAALGLLRALYQGTYRQGDFDRRESENAIVREMADEIRRMRSEREQ